MISRRSALISKATPSVLVWDISETSKPNTVFAELDLSTMALRIYGTGNTIYHNSQEWEWEDYRSQITSVVIEEGITKILGYGALKNMSVEYLSVPSTLTQFSYYNGIACDVIDVASIGAWCGLTVHEGELAPHLVTTGGTFKVNGAIQTSINIPNNITKLWAWCFINSNVSSVSAPSVNTINSSVFKNCTNLTNVDVPLVKSIGSNAFYGCTNLANINMPLVTSIGYGSFQNCSSLSSVYIPLVTSISHYGFYGCTGFTSIDLSSVTSIGESAFERCSNCDYFNFANASTIPTLASSNAFNNNKSTYEIRVPTALYNDWIVAPKWSNIASHIVAV